MHFGFSGLYQTFSCIWTWHTPTLGSDITEGDIKEHCQASSMRHSQVPNSPGSLRLQQIERPLHFRSSHKNFKISELCSFILLHFIEAWIEAGWSIAMQRLLKVAAPSRLWGCHPSDLPGQWPRSAMAMATKIKVDGGKNFDEGTPGVNPAERKAFRFLHLKL